MVAGNTLEALNNITAVSSRAEWAYGRYRPRDLVQVARVAAKEMSNYVPAWARGVDS